MFARTISPPDAPVIRSGWVCAHRQEVWRYLRFLGCDPQRAEDLTHDVLLRAMRARFRDAGVRARRAWLRTIARNAYRNALRDRTPEQLEAAERVWVEECGADGGEAYVAAVRLCVAQLKERSRRAVELRYVEGLSRQAMANELGMTEDGVKSLLRRVRMALRACVERRLHR